MKKDIVLSKARSLLGDLERVFIGMGYEVVCTGTQEVVNKTINTTLKMLNIPCVPFLQRDEQDTFYINKDIVLGHRHLRYRLRTTETGTTPIRMIAPGRAFRSHRRKSMQHILHRSIR